MVLSGMAEPVASDETDDSAPALNRLRRLMIEQSTIRVGDTFTMPMATYRKRKFWQLWKPRWIEQPATLNQFRVISASADNGNISPPTVPHG